MLKVPSKLIRGLPRGDCNGCVFYKSQYGRLFCALPKKCPKEDTITPAKHFYSLKDHLQYLPITTLNNFKHYRYVCNTCAIELSPDEIEVMEDEQGHLCCLCLKCNGLVYLIQ